MYFVVRKYDLNWLISVLLAFSLITLAICRTFDETKPNVVDSDAIKIQVLHTNDLHSRFDEVTISGSKCRDKDRRKNICVGGVARIKHMVDQIRNQHKPDDNVLFLNAGDFFQVCYIPIRDQILLLSGFTYSVSES